MGIKDDMPLLARHEGEWVGTYIDVDPEGNVLDRYQSHLSCQFPTEGPYQYYQLNTYTWPDGKQQVHHFPATYKDKRIYFDTERIQGHAWEIDQNVVILTWTYGNDPSTGLYETIYLSPDGNHRTRNWQWMTKGVLSKRTLIKETRKSSER